MPLQVQLLATSSGDSTQYQPLTSFLLNGTIALDAGSFGFSLSSEELAKVEHVVLTHSHLDHTASLPLAIDAVYPLLKRPMRIYGTLPTLSAVRTHLFNDEVWADFPNFKLLGTDRKCMEWTEIQPRKTFTIDGLQFTPIPVVHPVPTVGFIIRWAGGSVVFTSDTWKTEEIWAEAAKLPDLRAVFVECSFPNEMAKLAEQAGHLTPELVAEETAKMGKNVPIHCVHLKPALRETLREQLYPYAARGITPAEVGKMYTWP